MNIFSKKLVSQGNKLKDDHLEALVFCHAEKERVEMILLQRTAAEIIRQSVDSDYHSIFDLPHTSCNKIEVQGTMYLKELILKYYTNSVQAPVSLSISVLKQSYRRMGTEVKIKFSMF